MCNLHTWIEFSSPYIEIIIFFGESLFVMHKIIGSRRVTLCTKYKWRKKSFKIISLTA